MQMPGLAKKSMIVGLFSGFFCKFLIVKMVDLPERQIKLVEEKTTSIFFVSQHIIYLIKEDGPK